MSQLNIAQITKVIAYETITVADTAIGFTTATYDNANTAFMTLETAQIRFRVDGTNPISTEGHILDIGQTLEIEGKDNLTNFKAIRTGAVSGVLKISYER